ncbi:DUF3299 domain-containing protein [Ruegeria arenilitoris]|uniref:DUF3299 domain-containing protein n=1 Tax=Ruegeria arenilitoris TaxID=1173585 RepID=UPI00346385FB
MLASDLPHEIRWKDLVPLKARGASYDRQALSHSSLPSRTFSDPRHYAIVPELNHQRVRLPGFLVSLEFDKTRGTEFLLVPFIGACIHVPPPPPNQVVYAISKQPQTIEGMFEPVYAVGVLRTVFAETDLAHSSYSMQVEEFEKVEF